jgi:hypothetical protein
LHLRIGKEIISHFSFLHYLTILSLHKHNPDIKIIVYTPLNSSNKLVEWSTGEHSIDINNKYDFNSITTISHNISIEVIDFKTNYNIDDSISCVYKADFTRIIKLYEQGGMWFDFDILFIKPIPSYVFNNEYEIIYFIYDNTIPTGLLISSPKNGLITKLAECVNYRIKNLNNNYQQIGPHLWREYCIQDKDTKKKLITTSDIYPYLWNEIHLFFESNNNKIVDNTWGIHWYNGSANAKIFINNYLNNIEKDVIVNHYISYIMNM